LERRFGRLVGGGMRRTVLSSLIAAIATGACVIPAAQDPEARRLDVSEAVLRHMFKEHQEDPRRPVAYCVGVRERFPGDVTEAPPELIARLGDVRLAVKPYSGCLSTLQVLDAETTGPAVSFLVGPIECNAPNRCTAMGGYTVASLSGRASGYVLERRGRSWVVVGEELRAIS